MTVEVATASDFDTLKTQILESKTQKEAPTDKPQDVKPEVKAEPVLKKNAFSKGDKSWDVDEDAEIEINADRNKYKLTLRELKERAAGEIAVKNRLQSLAEEKKRVQATLKDFTAIAKKDPLRALEYISEKAKEADSEFEYNAYLSSLADQAERMAKMSEPERRAYKAESKLERTQEELSNRQLEQQLLDQKSEIMDRYALKPVQFDKYLDAVMNNPALMEGLKSEQDVMNRVAELAHETARQTEVVRLLQKIDPTQSTNEKLIMSASELMRTIPDLDEDDLAEILSEWTGPNRKAQAQQRMSERQRSTLAPKSYEGLSDFEILTSQLQEEREERKNKSRR